MNLANRMIDEGMIRKIDIRRAADMSASVLDAYLKGTSTPGMDAGDKIAAALGFQSLADALDPGSPAVPPHLQDIVKILSHAPPPVLDAVRALLMGYAKGVELDPPPSSRASLPEHRDDLPQKRKQRGK